MKQVIIFIILLIVIKQCNQIKHQKFRHRKGRQHKKSKQDIENKDGRRLNSKLIDDERIVNNDEEQVEDKAKVEYVKTQEDYDKYNSEKDNSEVQKNYMKNRQGKDQFGDSFIGNLYLIQQNLKVGGEFGVYLNEYALYWTEKGSRANIGYRNILGSVSLKYMIEEDEKVRIKEGDCCRGVSKVLFFQKPDKYEEKEKRDINDDLRQYMLTKMANQKNTFSGMTCIQLKYHYYANGEQYLALCSLNVNLIIDLKNRLNANIIKKVMYDYGITDYTIVQNSNQDANIIKNQKDFQQYINWSYDKWQSWPKQCKVQKLAHGLKSPVLFNDELFPNTDNHLQLQSQQQQLNQDQISFTFDQLIVEEVIDDLWGESVPKSLLQSYYNHPTYTYRGLHENFLIGNLGSLELQNNQNKETYYAFAIKFKLPSEHKFGEITYNGEIQVHLTKKSQLNLDNMKNLLGLGQNSLPYKQFARGYVESDSILMESLIDKQTDLILSLPLLAKEDYAYNNLFLHYINHEDWFEAKQADQQEDYSIIQNQNVKEDFKIVNKDLEKPLIQEIKEQTDGLEHSEQKTWELMCYPGSIKCLVEQIKTAKSFYFYQGTITTPPCKQPVTWIVMKNPIKIKKDDFNNLYKNVFQFRDDILKSNINRYITNINQKDIENKNLIRQIDNNKVDCTYSDDLKLYIQKTMKKVQNTQSDEIDSNINIDFNQQKIRQENEYQLKLKQMMEDKHLTEKIKSGQINSNEWYQWFQQNQERYYRRLFATHKLQNSIDDLKLLATDALSAFYDFNYNFSSSQNKNDDDQDENAIVMVSGTINHKQQLSAKNIKKVQKVIDIADKKQQEIDKSQKLSSNYVKIQIDSKKDTSKRKRFLRKI